LTEKVEVFMQPTYTCNGTQIIAGVQVRAVSRGKVLERTFIYGALLSDSCFCNDYFKLVSFRVVCSFLKFPSIREQCPSLQKGKSSLLGILFSLLESKK